MLYQLLNQMYDLNIQLEKEQDRFLVHGEAPEDLLQVIKKHKQEIIQRLQDNKQAMDLGFTVHQHGELYEYRYGKRAYLFIERHPGDLASAWKETVVDTPNKPNRIKEVCHNVRFAKAFKDAAGFVEWLNRKRNS
jgi:flagellar biosynthesis/type III secretory pathway chaperone